MNLKTSDGKDIIPKMLVEFSLDHKVVQGVVISMVDDLVFLHSRCDPSHSEFGRFAVRGADEIKSVAE